MDDLIEMRGPEGASCSWGGDSFEPNDDGVIFVPPGAVGDLLAHGFDTVEHIREAEEEDAARAETEYSDEAEVRAAAQVRLDAEIERQAPEITAEQHVAVSELAWDAPTNGLVQAVAWAIDQNIRKEKADAEAAAKAQADQDEMNAAHASIETEAAAKLRDDIRAEILVQEPDATEERIDFLLAKIDEAGPGAFPNVPVAVNAVIAESPAPAIVLAPEGEGEMDTPPPAPESEEAPPETQADTGVEEAEDGEQAPPVEVEATQAAEA